MSQVLPWQSASYIPSSIPGMVMRPELATQLQTLPPDPPVSYGTLFADISTATFSNGAVFTDTVFCPDPASDKLLCGNLVGVAVDPTAILNLNNLAVPCNQIKNIVVWMKGTKREGDFLTTPYPIWIYLGIGGFTKYAQTTFLLPADGEWHPLIVNTSQFGINGGFSWDSSELVDRIRIKPIDMSQQGNYGYNAPNVGESVLIGQVRYNPWSQPYFIVRFDDSINDVLYPNPTVNFPLPDGTPAPVGGWSGLKLLQHYGFRGTCFHLTKRIGTSNNVSTFLTWQDLKTLADQGWANCFQTHCDPINTVNDGIRLLGPSGYVAKNVASVDTSGNTITASVAHNMPQRGTYSVYPVMFAGSALPAPLVINKVYWAIGTTATAFQLFPTEQDAINNTNVIDITTTGTPASFTFRNGLSANDYSQYTADLTIGMKLLADHGFAEESKYWALNQGATDGEVMRAAMDNGVKAVFGVYRGTTLSYFLPGYPHCEFNGTNPALEWKAIMKVPQGRQTDAQIGVLTEADIRGYVDAICESGGIGMNYHHRLTNGNGPQLAWLLDQLKLRSDQGKIKVVTAPEIPMNF